MTEVAHVLDRLAAEAPVGRLSWNDVVARSRTSGGRVRRRRAALALGVAALLAAAGTAVAERLDLLAQQDEFHATTPDDPERLGPLVEIVSGDEWSLIAWRSAAGVCVDFAVPGNSPFSCGFPVRGAKPPSDTSGSGPPIHAVAGSVSGGGLVGGDGKSTIFGVASREVAYVRVELRGGRVLDAPLYAAPPELGADVQFFIVRLHLPPQRLGEPSQVTAFIAYDRRGGVIERSTL
jgi:hypothetical protein